MLDIFEALQCGTLRLNDSNFLFDDAKIYHIETVLSNSRKASLADAVVKGLVDKKKCTYKFLNMEYSIKEAMKKNYIEGRILTSYEIKWLLDDYARRIESKLNIAASNKSLNRSAEDDSPPVQTATITSNKLHGIPLESFNEFFIFDPDSERYVPMSKAFYTGVILNEPVRIKDPASSNYVLVKDAIIKGLVACQKSDKRVAFKERSSFLTHNRVSYIIDCVYDPKKTLKFSLQEAIRTKIFSNGIFYLSLFNNISKKL
jgi:hypothetical protein